MPFFRGEIYIIKVDVAGQIALLGQPDRKHMCLLYRKPVVEPAIAKAWLKIGEAQGFSTSNLVWPINSAFEIPAPRY
jgi:apolipoprotein D and lipocalin family protein